jgi:hypothetical protein
VVNRGEAIYVGHVFPLHGTNARPTYVYERRVDGREGQLVSTHVTRDPAGAIQLAESAAHSRDYALSEYTLYANQLGQTGDLRVQDHQVAFRLSDGKTEQLRVEKVAGDVVVGPTLIGYVLRRLDGLMRGDVAEVRLAVLEGRVPTKIRDGERWKDFDARVEYSFVAPSYR